MSLCPVPRSDHSDYSPAVFLCTTNLYFTHDEMLPSFFANFFTTTTTFQIFIFL